MNNTNTVAPQVPLEQLEMGQQWARLLTQASAELPHDLSERLRIARQQALAVRKVAAGEPVLAMGGRLALAGPGSEGMGLWSVLGSAVPLLALVAGLVATQWLDHEQFVSEIAEIDSALLVDDLPPAAYSDPGFIQFLRQSGSKDETQD